VTATVESIPLICGSILSKKAAAGTKFLVMDVKCGSGAFMDSVEKARELSRGLIDIGGALGMKVSSLLTQMSQPLGEAVGNAIEIRETIDLLKGGGPADAREITLQLCAGMLVLPGLAKNQQDAMEKLTRLLDSGKALEKFTEWIAAQGGDPRIVDDQSLLVVTNDIDELKADRSGYIQSIMTRDVGVAGNILGGGRMKTDDVVDTAVGFIVPAKPGDKVNAGDTLVNIHHRGGKNLDAAKRMLREAIVIGDAPVKALPLIIERMA